MGYWSVESGDKKKGDGKSFKVAYFPKVEKEKSHTKQDFFAVQFDEPVFSDCSL